LIFLTVGTQKFQFDRLLKIIDELVEEDIISDKVIAQIGYSTYKPKRYDSFQFKSENEIIALMGKSDILISHSGIGSITTALTLQKKVIVVPRLKKYKEHVDNHQLEIAKEYKEKGLITVASNKRDLIASLENIDYIEFKRYIPQEPTIIRSIREYLASI